MPRQLRLVAVLCAATVGGALLGAGLALLTKGSDPELGADPATVGRTAAAAGSQPRDAADLDSQSAYPTIRPGESARIRVSVRNVGNTTWYAGGVGGYAYEGREAWASRGRRHLPRDVRPGDTIAFAEAVRPPSRPGKYRYALLVLRNGVSIGPYFYIDVTVAAQSQSHSGSESGV